MASESSIIVHASAQKTKFFFFCKELKNKRHEQQQITKKLCSHVWLCSLNKSIEQQRQNGLKRKKNINVARVKPTEARYFSLSFTFHLFFILLR